MLFEVGSSIVMAGIAGYAYIKSNGAPTNDTEKILRILNNSGLKVKEGKETKTIRIMRKNKFDGGMEYVFQLPLGLSSKQVIDNKHVLEDGLNTRQKTLILEPKELLNIKWDRTAFKQIKRIVTTTKTTRKEIEIDFDGMLRIKVYNESMADKVPWSDDLLKPGTWSVCIGKNRNELIYHDFDKTKHLIIAGVPGSGKSVVMKLIIASLILSKPDDVTFSLIDLKGGPAFGRFKNAKQVKNLGVDNREALEILTEVQQEMNDVYKNTLVPNGFEDVTEAGIKKRHFIVIDEAADLAGDKDAVEILTDIVRKGRGSGHYVIYATQYPTVQTIASQIKRNIPARLTYVLDSGIASTTVLDTTGAEDLPEIPGRGIYKMVKQKIIQTPFISNKEIEERIAPFINIRPRKDEHHGQNRSETTEDRKHPIIFEKV